VREFNVTFKGFSCKFHKIYIVLYPVVLLIVVSCSMFSNPTNSMHSIFIGVNLTLNNKGLKWLFRIFLFHQVVCLPVCLLFSRCSFTIFRKLSNKSGMYLTPSEKCCYLGLVSHTLRHSCAFISSSGH